MNETMSGLDVESVLAAHAQENATVKDHDGEPWKYDGTHVCPCGVEYKAAPGIGGAFRGHRAHVAAVLREQIAAAQAEAWDEGRAAGSRDVATRADDWTRNPYRAALVAPSRELGEET